MKKKERHTMLSGQEERIIRDKRFWFWFDEKVRIAEWLISKGHPEKARPLIDDALKLEFQVSALENEFLAKKYLKNEEYSKAILHLEKAIYFYPKGSRLYIQLAPLYANHSRLEDRDEKAMECYRKAIEVKGRRKAPSLWIAYYCVAIELMGRKHYEEAIDHLRCVIKLNRGFLDAYEFLFFALFEDNRLRESAKVYWKWWKKAWRQVNRHMKRREYTEAIHIYEQLRNVHPNEPVHYFLLGVARLKGRRYDEETIKCFERAIELGTDGAAIYQALGWLELNVRKDFKKAKASFLIAQNKPWEGRSTDRDRSWLSGLACLASAMAEWQDYRFEKAEKEFLKSADEFKPHFGFLANRLVLYSQIVPLDRTFQILPTIDDLIILTQELEKISCLTGILFAKIKQEQKKESEGYLTGLVRPSITDLIEAKRDLMKILLGSLKGKRVNSAVLRGAGKTLEDMKFDGSKQVIDGVEAFTTQLPVLVRKFGDLKVIPQNQIRQLLHGIRPVFLIMDGEISQYTMLENLKDLSWHIDRATSEVKTSVSKIGFRLDRVERAISDHHKDFTEMLTQRLPLMKEGMAQERELEEIPAKEPGETRPVPTTTGQVYEVYTKGKKSRWEEQQVELLKKTKSAFDIWVDLDKPEILVKGRPQIITGELQYLLYLFLQNVGGRCTYQEIAEETWDDLPLQPDRAIQQLKSRLCGPDGILSFLQPYVVGRPAEYYIKEGFNYCMIKKIKKDKI